jgi:putative nucleotidyltransferase with HDIG domain
MSGQLSALLVHAGEKAPIDAFRLLKADLSLQTIRLRRLLSLQKKPSDVVIFDASGLADDEMAGIADWRLTVAGRTVATVFITDPASRTKLIQRGLNEGANLVRRPLENEDLPGLMRQLRQRYSLAATRETDSASQGYYALFPDQAEALQAGDAILDEIFGGLANKDRLDAGDIARRSTLIIDSLGETGLPGWVNAVRAHHNLTYQHCLLVTGSLLAFGHHLRMNRADLQRLAVGGLLHDLGKADVPLGILDKPTSLTPDELTIMRGHPLSGVRRLESMAGVTPQLMSFVRDHHEYLDGSGYPNGLTGQSISDPVRLLTIADIFAALIERRSYKREMQAENALEIMLAMGAQLDRDILASVRPVMLKVRP